MSAKYRVVLPVLAVAALGAVVTTGLVGHARYDQRVQRTEELQVIAAGISGRAAAEMIAAQGVLAGFDGLFALPGTVRQRTFAEYSLAAMQSCHHLTSITYRKADSPDVVVPAGALAATPAQHRIQVETGSAAVILSEPVAEDPARPGTISARVDLPELLHAAADRARVGHIQLLQEGRVVWSTGARTDTTTEVVEPLTVTGLSGLALRVGSPATPGDRGPNLVLAAGVLLTAGACLLQWRWLDNRHLERTAEDLDRATDRLRYLTDRDPLTGTANREALVRWLDVWDTEHPQRGLGLVYVDLDSFRQFNATYGHVSGDVVLHELGRRLRVLSEDGDSIVARVAGDHFVVIRALDRGSLAGLAVTVRALVGAPLTVGDRDVHVTCSLGVVRRPDDGRTLDTLLSNADHAVRQAKRRHGDRIVHFEPAMAAEGAHLAQRTRDLRAAIQRPDESFRLVFQPQVDMRTGALIAAEALVRWRGPGGVDVPPAEFIPLASENGLVPAIGRWVLRDACRTVVSWRTTVPAVVAVNVDARELQEGFAAQVAATLHHSGARPEWLVIEVTESAAMTPGAQQQLEQLRTLGVGISIDDFGTGYSSLSRLTELPTQQVKIDRVFVTGLDRGGGSLEIVRTIVALADALGLQVLAEGVESADQAAVLLEQGIIAGQGYAYSPPVGADSCLRLWQTGVGSPLVRTSG